MEGRIARYAWNNDYHDLIDKMLKAVNSFLESRGGTQRFYVDTGPVLERDFASESGLGWGGKSTMQIHRSLGTWFFLAEILTTLELEPDSPAHDLCGKCTRCITACPTQAITAPRRMDARRCISYLTIESKSPIPLEFRRAIGDRLYGCDECLTACPWNRFAQTSHEAWFQARESVFGMHLRDMLTLDDDAFRALFAKSPIKRIKRPAFLRNVCVVLGNIGTAEDLPSLECAAHDEHPLISEHAQWALEEIRLRMKDGMSLQQQWRVSEPLVASCKHRTARRLSRPVLGPEIAFATDQPTFATVRPPDFAFCTQCIALLGTVNEMAADA